MTDIFSKKQRSKNMAAIRSRLNKSTEIATAKIFRLKKIKGWRRHIRKLPGTPDFVFSKKKIALFIDGCFWHGCKKHYKVPKTNRIYWQTKIKRNILRDKTVNKSYKKMSWRVLRFWEHDINKNLEKITKKINSYTHTKKSP